MWVIKYEGTGRLRGEKVWTVGYYSPDRWEPHKDFSSQDDAARYIHYLNGGNSLETFKE